MQREIKVPYNKPGTCLFLGRNGSFSQFGIELTPFFSFVDDTHTVRLAPIRKNGQIGRASMDIPIQDIPELIQALQTMYDQYTPTPTTVPPTMKAKGHIGSLVKNLPTMGDEPRTDGPQTLSIKVGRNYRLKNGYIAHIDGRDLVKNPLYPFFTKFRVDHNLWFAEDGSNGQYEGKLSVVEEVSTPKFEIGKKYVNRNLDVTTITYITETVNGNPLILHGFNQNGVCENWRGDGQFAAWQTSVLDLVDEYREQ